MKFTFNWLKEFVTINISPTKLAEMLTMAGLEVESVTPLREPETNREDCLFEIGVTPNRGDCLGITGLAAEIAALTGGRMKAPPVRPHSKGTSMAKRVSVAIQSPRLCSRYSARIIDDVQLGPSPAWMRFRLDSCGIRSINNIVDITNYVMLETGQPLHAFDLDRLPTRGIVIRPANEIEKLTTLDGVERELAPEDLLICDGAIPIALAGVMGGTDTEVTATTRSVLLESANFDPTSIRRTAKRLGLHSEASHRFERGVDPERTVVALDRAAYLLASLGGGDPAPGLIDRYPRRPKSPVILLREKRVEEIIGARIDGGRVEKLLRSLGLKAHRQGKSGTIKVVPPSSRPDLSREADLIEELARLYGYHKIPSTLPRLGSSTARTDYRLGQERRIRSFLAGEGLAEVINLPFTTDKLNRAFPGFWEGETSPVEVLNPLVKESAEMRLSLIPGLIDNLRVNLAQRVEGFSAYHLGKVFRLAPDGSADERQWLGGILYGRRARRGLRAGEEPSLGFLECKGLVEGILEVLSVSAAVTWSREAAAFLHPGRATALDHNGKSVGYLGQVHPDFAEESKLPPFLLFELDFEELLKYAPRQINARPLPRFPSVERDFAVIVDRDFPSQQIVNWIKDRGEPLIQHVEVFDQYLGSPIPKGKKSLAYQISYRADDRTLMDSEVSAVHQHLVDQIAEFFGGQLRS
jgi:phenylalanyl-tRNA synthetase beta chain